MRRALSMGVILLAFAVCAARAQELSVSYVEGEVQQARSGSSWTALSIGDRLTSEVTIQLSGGAYVELPWANAKFALSQKGTYLLRDIMAISRALDSAGVWKTLSTKLSILLTGPVHNQTNVAGARAGNESKAEDSEWVTSGAQVFLDTGMQYLKSGQYKEALEQFLQALDEATEKESPLVHYNLALAYSLSGDTRAALKHAAGLQPGSTDEWAPDFIILKAKLLFDSNAFAQEIAWLTQSGNDLSQDAHRAAIYNFLLGVGYHGIGDTSREKASLSKVAAISEESDLAKAAAQLLQNP
jgi:tetratricopeptide (TPR) repeat protein